MTVGCFGNSEVDCWMARNLDRYLGEDAPGSRTVAFKLFKGKKLLRKWNCDISDEDSCYHDMKATLVDIHTMPFKKYLKEMMSGPSLFHAPYKGPHTFFNPETSLSYYGSINKDAQQQILERWAMLPKIFSIANKHFNLMRMGKYSIVCYDPSTQNEE